MTLSTASPLSSPVIKSFVSLSCLLLLLAISTHSYSANFLIKKTDDAITEPNNSGKGTKLLKKSKNQAANTSGIAVNDLAQAIEPTALRRSREVNTYNTNRKLHLDEIVTVKQIKGVWAKVQTQSDEFGWLFLDNLKKVATRTVYTTDWVELIAPSISAIRSCHNAMLARDRNVKNPRVIHIAPQINDVVITWFQDTSPTTAYRCTTGAYGGEVHRFEPTSRADTPLDSAFTPQPGQPLPDSCYANEILIDSYQRTLGWLSKRTCR